MPWLVSSSTIPVRPICRILSWSAALARYSTTIICGKHVLAQASGVILWHCWRRWIQWIRVQNKLFTIVHRCLRNKVHQCLSDWTATLLSQLSPVGSICDRPAVISRSYHVRCSAVGPSLSLVRRSGTRCQTVYETQHVPPTYRGISTLFCSHFISVHGALEA